MGPGFGGVPGGWWLLVLVVGLVLLVWGLAKAYGPGTRHQPGGGPSPEELLRERFARGELTEVEYRQRLQVLRND